MNQEIIEIILIGGSLVMLTLGVLALTMIKAYRMIGQHSSGNEKE